MFKISLGGLTTSKGSFEFSKGPDPSGNRPKLLNVALRIVLLKSLDLTNT